MGYFLRNVDAFPLTRRRSGTEIHRSENSPSRRCLRGDDVTREDARATASRPRCQGYAWTINGPGCNQRDYKRCSLNASPIAIINVRQIGQPCRFCK